MNIEYNSTILNIILIKGPINPNNPITDSAPIYKGINNYNNME